MKTIRKNLYLILFYLSAFSMLSAQGNPELLYTLDAGLPASGLNSDGVGEKFSVLGDINGDGYDDWATAINGANYELPNTSRWSGAVHIYLGSSQKRGSETPADIVIYGDENNQIGNGVWSAGDVNGDGYDDILIYCLRKEESSGNYIPVHALYYGSQHFDSNEDLVFTKLDQHAGTANFSSAAGDVNNDGFDDILLSIPTYIGGVDTGHVYLYYGAEDMDNAPDIIFSGTVRPPSVNGGALNFGGATRAGDVNGDGFDDILISTSNSANLYLGAVHMDKTEDAVYNDVCGTALRTGPLVTAVGDVNKDGYDDIIYATSTAFLCFGNDFVNDVPDIIIPMWNENGDRMSVSAAGDVNNDGFDDILLGTNTMGSIELGQVGLFLGSAEMDSIVDVMFDAPQPWTVFGYSVSGNGDFNGDGFSDMLIGDVGNVSSIDEHDEAGSISLYYGGQSLSNQADAVFSGIADAEGFGSAVANAGDVNNDGYPDILVGASQYWEGYYAGRVYLFYGAEIPHKKPDLVFKSTTAYNGNQVFFGQQVGSAGDVNGDGFADIFIREKYKVSLFLGGAPMDTLVDKIFNLQVSTDFDFCAVGDVNKDGYDDLLYGKPFQGSAGAAVVFLGAANLNDAQEITINGSNTGDSFGKKVAAAGDMNKDGYADFLVAIPGSDGYGEDLGMIKFFFGDSLIPTSQSIEYPPPDGDSFSYDFGFHLCGARDINGDGYNDVVVSKGLYSLTENSNEGRIYIYYGGPETDKNVDVILTGSSSKMYLGLRRLKLIPDMNGDGFAEILTSEGNYTSAGDDHERAVIFYGGTSTDSQSDINLSCGSVNGKFDIYYDNQVQEIRLLAGDLANSAAGPQMGRVFVHSGNLTGIENTQVAGNTVTDFTLYQNYPNPFNPTTAISYQLSTSSHVDLIIYNVLGQKVATLVSGKQTAGYHQVNWNASGFPSGLYFYQLKTANLTQTRRMLLIR